MSSAPCPSCGSALASTARFCSRCGSATGFAPPSAVEHPLTNPPQVRHWPPQHQQLPYQQPEYQQPPYHQPIVQQQIQVQQTYGYGYPVAPSFVHPVERKDKTAAVLLAVFLGLWTWVYTYKKDAWKFWLSMALHLTLFNPLWTWMVVFLPNFALHAWAIIDVAVKPETFYEYYPNC